MVAMTLFSSNQEFQFLILGFGFKKGGVTSKWFPLKLFFIMVYLWKDKRKD